jgi:hypothetical protein
MGVYGRTHIYPIRCATSRHCAPWGSILAPSGITLASFCSSWASLGAPWELFGDGVVFETFPPRKSHPFWVPFWLPKSKMSWKSRNKKQCPRSSVEKTCFQSPSEMAKSVIRIVITMCFERSDIIHLGGFWPPFGSLLESLFYTFCKNVIFGSSKTGIQKKHWKWLWALKENLRSYQLEAGRPRGLRCWV